MKLCVLALLALGLQTAAAADRFDEIRAIIRTEVERKSVTSLSVAVAQNGRIIWEEGFGWADREKQIKATEHTVYSLASVSKPMTAVGLMIARRCLEWTRKRPARRRSARTLLTGALDGATEK